MELCSIASGSSGNCIYVGSDHTHLIVDAGISGKRIEAGLNEIGLKTSEMDGILITHEHGDHLDPEALKALTGEKTRLLANAASAAKLAGVEGVPAPEVMANGDKRIIVFEERPESSVQPGDVIVEAVPAYNTTPGREKFHPKGNGNGYVLTLDGLRIYIAGDTEDIPEMAELKDIDVAFLPCNQPYTMTPDQCVHAAQMVRPKVLIPYHFGETDITALPDRLPGMKVLLRQMQ